MAKHTRVPGYRLHKASGRAVVTLSGRDHYLGEYDSPASRQAYNRLMAEWQAGGGKLAREISDGPTIAELASAWVAHATRYYRKRGRPTGQVNQAKRITNDLNQLYGDLPTSDFGPKALKAVRAKWINAGCCRRTVNQQTDHLRRIFGWGAEHELVPPSTWHGLLAVSNLKEGRSEAPERDPVRPVDIGDFAPVADALCCHMRAVLWLMWHTGMRPAEALAIRPRDIDRTSDLPSWIYVVAPEVNKNAHRKKPREVAFGPQSREILRPWLDQLAFKPDAYLFPPRIHVRRDHHVAVSTLRGSVRKKCRKLEISPWCPSQIRHTFATRARARAGIEAAQVSLGHARMATTEIYAESNRGEAIELAEAMG
jgi:integrase